MDHTAHSDTTLELLAPDTTSRTVNLTTTPFFIGRGDEENQLAIPDMRISRQCASIINDSGRYYVLDRSHRRGVFVNGERITKRPLDDGDVITFGLDDSFRVVFHTTAGSAEAVQDLISRMGSVGESDLASGGLGKLNLLLEATRLLHSQLPLDAILDAMLDRAISITNADRGLLIEMDETGMLRNWLAHRRGSEYLAPEDISPSQTAVNMAIEKGSGVITEDLQLADDVLQGAQSIVAQRLRAVVALPLYAAVRANTHESMIRIQRGEFLGVLYLDSPRPTAFSMLDRQILDAIAIESASILDNARLVKREQERKRIEQELNIARDIQQALLPRGLRDFPYLSISGQNASCHAVGGDYFDVFPLDERRTAFLIADVSGKGLGAALLTTMLQGALTGMTIGADPARVFQHINEFLVSHEDVGRYATLFFGSIDTEGNLEYLNAGHLSPLLLHGDEVTELFTEGSFPVGLVPGAEYMAVRTKLEPGDTLVLFSDGITEAADIRDEFFGLPRLKATVAGHSSDALDDLRKIVFQAVNRFALGAEQADDMTVLLVRYRKPPN